MRFGDVGDSVGDESGDGDGDSLGDGGDTVPCVSPRVYPQRPQIPIPNFLPLYPEGIGINSC